MKHLTLTSTFILITLLINAQNVRLEMGTVMNAAGQPVSDGIMIYGAESLKKNVTYEDVKGTPYFEDFRWAKFYDEKNNLLGTAQARINFYTSQVHYLNEKNNELVIGPEWVKMVKFVDANNADNVLETYVSDVDAINLKLNKPFYVRVLNDGNVRLLKFQQKNIGTYDSLMGNFKRYMFTTRSEYYMQRQKTVEPLRKLSKERVHAVLRSERDMEEFVKANNIDYRKEDDLVKLFNYYNQSTKQ